jgi:hypothetical protein
MSGPPYSPHLLVPHCFDVNDAGVVVSLRTMSTTSIITMAALPLFDEKKRLFLLLKNMSAFLLSQ